MGLFQPDFIWVIFRKMIPSKYNRTNDDIQQSVNEWCIDSTKAEAKYGHISEWNTSLVTNMKNLFKYKRDFNDDISKWNVGKVTDMSYMFGGYFFGQISSFNGISLDGMSAVLLTWNTCSEIHPSMGISLDGM